MEFSDDEKEQFWAKAFVAVTVAFLTQAPGQIATQGQSAIPVAADIADNMLQAWIERWGKE